MSKVSEMFIPSEASPHGMYMAIFSLYLHLVFPLSILCVQIFPSQKDTSHVVLGQIWSPHFFLFVDLLIYFRSAPAAYGGSQARGPIGTVASALHHSHSNSGSKLCLQPTPQLMATPDP